MICRFVKYFLLAAM